MSASKRSLDVNHNILLFKMTRQLPVVLQVIFFISSTKALAQKNLE